MTDMRRFEERAANSVSVSVIDIDLDAVQRVRTGRVTSVRLGS